MERRAFHGNISPSDVAQVLTAEFNQGNLRTQLLGSDDNISVQIASSQLSRSGGKTALTINIQRHEDGILVQVGEQQWFGVAASLGQTVLATVLNPINLIGRLDDIAQDVSNLQLKDNVWEVITTFLRNKGIGTKISERLSRLSCEYCGSTNPVGEPVCIMCGAPLGKIQPKSCNNCGFITEETDSICMNCGELLR